MSLIVASSSQQGYSRGSGVNTRTALGIENPSQFQNYFTSPIKLPPNAEIAVESIKIRRDALIDVEDETLMYSYFGHLQDENSEEEYKQQRVEMPIPIKPKPGVYDVDAWVKEVEERLDESYGNPDQWGTWEVDTIVDTDGECTGVKMSNIQRGSAAGQNRVSNTTELLSPYWHAPYQLSDGGVYGTDWSSVHSTSKGAHKVFTRLIANNASDDTVLKKLDRRECSVIGHGHPLGLVAGKFHVNVVGAKDGGWRVGLSRPQLEYVRDTTKVGARGRANLLPGTRHPEGGLDDGVARSTHYNMTNQSTGRYQKDFYDYMVQSDGNNIEVYQLSYDNEVYANKLVQSEVLYYGTHSPIAAKMTNASFNASFVSVEFETVGDEIKLSFVNASGALTTVVSSTLSTIRNECFLPIGETRNALYPRLNVGTQNDTLNVWNWHSHYNETTFRFPSYVKQTFTFTTGDDFYSNNRVDRFDGSRIGGDLNQAIQTDLFNRPYCLSQTLLCDTKKIYEINSVSAETRDSAFDGVLADNAGIDKKRLFIIGYVEPFTVEDYLEGKYRTTDTSGRAKMNRLLGFQNKSVITQPEGIIKGYATVSASGAQVDFDGYKAPDYRVHSAFVRISNMPIQSYNGNKQSVSKVLYHLPRFTNDGREYGDLFFSPGEKTYVSLHNTGSEILNNIEIQIVDINEKPVQDISGNTIIVFHLRTKV